MFGLFMCSFSCFRFCCEVACLLFMLVLLVSLRLLWILFAVVLFAFTCFTFWFDVFWFLLFRGFVDCFGCFLVVICLVFDDLVSVWCFAWCLVLSWFLLCSCVGFVMFVLVCFVMFC